MKTHDQKRRAEWLEANGYLCPSQISTQGRVVRIVTPSDFGCFDLAFRDYENANQARVVCNRLLTLLYRGLNVRNDVEAADEFLERFGDFFLAGPGGA